MFKTLNVECNFLHDRLLSVSLASSPTTPLPFAVVMTIAVYEMWHVAK